MGEMVLQEILLGLLALVGCVLVQALGLTWLIWNLGRLGRSRWVRQGFVHYMLVMVMTSVTLVLSLLLQIAVWAGLYLSMGEFSSFASAFYMSAANFTTLGASDLMLSPPRRILGALEAANGILMGGFAASTLYAIASRLQQIGQHVDHGQHSR